MISKPASSDIFPYTREELEALKKRDSKLSAVIDRYGFIEREINRDIFSALIDSIVSQQISGKAADTVVNRFSQRADLRQRLKKRRGTIYTWFALTICFDMMIHAAITSLHLNLR